MKRISFLAFLSCYLFALTSDGQLIKTVAGNGLGGGVITGTGGIVGGYSGDGGSATAAALNNPMYVAFDSHGNLFFSDMLNNRIRKVDASGIITTYAGTGDSAAAGHIIPGLYSGDGGPATAAKLNWPWGIAFDAADNLYIADVGNNIIRKVNTSGIISTYAGTYGAPPNMLGDGGPATAATLMDFQVLTADRWGNLFFIDNESFLRKIDTHGIITTIAGTSTGYYSGEGGPATNANLGFISDLAVDGSGNIYLADNNTNHILRINAAGIINTIAGTGVWGDAGDGGPALSAQFKVPGGMIVDAAGNLYIADAGKVRKVDTHGIISTVAGNGSLSFGGDGGPATAAGMYAMRGLALDAQGNLAIADQDNNRVREVLSLAANLVSDPHMNVITPKFSNPNNGNFLLEATLNYLDDDKLFIEIIDQAGHVVYTENVVATQGKIKTQVSLNGVGSGDYLLYLKSAHKKGIFRFAVCK